MTDYDGPDDEDWDDEIMHQGQEEPDCYSCSDSGCPACGYVDPENPEHLHHLARQIITGRAAQLPSLLTPATDAELAAVFTNLPAAAAATVQGLVQSATVTVTVAWLTDDDEQPF